MMVWAVPRPRERLALLGTRALRYAARYSLGSGPGYRSGPDLPFPNKLGIGPAAHRYRGGGVYLRPNHF